MSHYKQLMSRMLFNHLSMVVKATVLHQHFLFVKGGVEPISGVWFSLVYMDCQASGGFLSTRISGNRMSKVRHVVVLDLGSSFLEQPGFAV